MRSPTPRRRADGELSMSERRRAEIAEKRTRLAALKQAREEREAASRASASASLAASGLPTPVGGASRASSEAGRQARGSLGASTSSRNDEIENLLRGVGVGRERETVDAGSPGADNLRRSSGLGRSAGAGSSTAASAVGEDLTSSRASPTVEMVAGEPEWTAPSSEAPNDEASALPTLTSSSIEVYTLPPRPKVVYDKSIQTSTDLFPSASVQTAAADPSISTTTGGAGRETAEELRARIIAELEAERKQLDAEIAEEKRLAEEQLEVERARGLSGEKLSSVFANPAFVDFLEQSSKVVQRALSDSYDYLRDYTITTDASREEEEGKRAKVRLLGTWQDQQWGKGRSVTGVDWSPKFPELFVASYNKNPMAVNEPDGIAAVWNLHLLERPEFVFHAQSDILSIAFSPFHPNLVVGGTYSGQILLWDTRSRHSNPVLKTPLSASGHTHPVYSLSLVGTQNAHSLVSASTDGVVCTWTLDMLARPQETLELVHPAHNKTDEVSVTALGFPLGETTTFWCATEEGNVYSANRYDRAGAKAGLVQSEIYRGHSGPVTGIDFHPVEGSVDLSDLFLTCGVDWTVKLWRAGGALGGPQAGKTGATSSKTSSSSGGANAIAPLLSFEEADEYVFDVKWHPLHPAVFGTVDGAGKFDLWNLNTDTEVPIISTAVGESSPAASRPLGGSSGRRGLNKLAWERKEGRRAAIGSSDGKVYVYELSQDLVTPREGEWDQMRKTCNAALAAQQQQHA
ncbi:Cytoplasmic dynein intermediate chain [Rhodotorula toruloides ATCC 204091]|uniref:BY PROTMAP: gi/342319386/gb/EGU11335.1/ Cytoplasmic dynein intermediate chain [Rhodotorula glutinis ATCC 204091] n=2 Tax=Rhodotorula toruloides TaxID=5286 RepID=A0A0K3CBG0_RHOTO|nr:Cytoplasmic dynein intermediate chain [Rhodotorula toruloides ATCC 204091]